MNLSAGLTYKNNKSKSRNDEKKLNERAILLVLTIPTTRFNFEIAERFQRDARKLAARATV